MGISISINQITVYSGNKMGKFAFTGLLAGFFLPFILSGDDDAICVSFFTIPSGLVAGAGVGALTKNRETYQVPPYNWQFTDINTIQSFKQ